MKLKLSTSRVFKVQTGEDIDGLLVTFMIPHLHLTSYPLYSAGNQFAGSPLLLAVAPTILTLDGELNFEAWRFN